MIKLYSVKTNNNSLTVEEGIRAEKGIIRTNHVNGFGEISCNDVSKALYCYQTLKSFLCNCKQADINDGYITNLFLENILSNEDLDSYTRTEEEAIFLLADYVRVKGNSLNKIFGRNPETGAYLLFPNEEIELGVPGLDNNELYEVIQSNGKGRQLYLNKVSHIYR